jgi:hypothetical protein
MAKHALSFSSSKKHQMVSVRMFHLLCTTLSRAHLPIDYRLPIGRRLLECRNDRIGSIREIEGSLFGIGLRLPSAIYTGAALISGPSRPS